MPISFCWSAVSKRLPIHPNTSTIDLATRCPGRSSSRSARNAAQEQTAGQHLGLLSAGPPPRAKPLSPAGDYLRRFRLWQGSERHDLHLTRVVWQHKADDELVSIGKPDLMMQ